MEDRNSSSSLNNNQPLNISLESNKNKEPFKIEIYKKKYIKISKSNYYYLIERDRYNLNSIMLLLDIKKLNLLGEKFRAYEQGVEMLNFIDLMKNSILEKIRDCADEASFVYGLFKLFKEIDFNDDKKMQWQEFTQYIIDIVEGENQEKIKRESKNKEKISGPETTDEKNLKEKNFQKYKRYEEAEKTKDILMHKSDIILADYFNKYKILFILEYGSRTLRMYNPMTGKNTDIFDIPKYFKEYERNKSNYIIERHNIENLYGRINKKRKKNSRTLRRQEDDDNEELKEFKRKIEEKKLLEEAISESTAYSVIYFHIYRSIIAICLSNSMILFFTILVDDKNEMIYQIKTPSLQKRIWYLKEHNIWFSSGAKEKNDKCFFLNELDIQFNEVDKRYVVLANEDHPYRKKYTKVANHEDEIYDAIEITRPFLLLTACLDGCIRLLNVNDDKFLEVWKRHSLGVKHLSFNANIDNVGYIISSGFDYYINVFTTDLSLREAFKGRLDGHEAPVLNSTFILDSPIILSIDQENSIRVWDVRNRQCLQLIPSNLKNFKPVNFYFIKPLNRFIVFGSKILFFESKYRDEVMKSELIKDKMGSLKLNLNYPLNIEYNKYYNEFYVQTQREIQTYNRFGSLSKVFKKLTENDHFEPEVQISSFLFDKFYRKFYCGFTNGAIAQYNAGTGSLIKAVNEQLIQKRGTECYKYDHNKDILSLNLFYQENPQSKKINYILMSAGLDSILTTYNEADPEKSIKLRNVYGGHTIKGKKNDILCMDFSENLNMLATGGSNGLLVIWQFELFKIDDAPVISLRETLGKKNDILHVKFLDPYSLLLSCLSDGSCFIWGVSYTDIHCSQKNLLRFMNIYTVNTNKMACPITKSQLLKAKFIIDSNDENNYLFKKDCIVKKKVYEEITVEMNNDMKKNLKRINTLAPGKAKILKEKENDDPLEYLTIDKELFPENYFAPDEKKLKEDNDSFNNYLFLCDEKGYAKILNLNGLIGKYQLKPTRKLNIKSTFNILKKENLNAETLLTKAIREDSFDRMYSEDSDENNEDENKEIKKIYKKKQYRKLELGQKINLYLNKILIKEWKAHNDRITCICIVEDPYTLVTASKDKHIKLWNTKFQNIGDINLFEKTIDPVNNFWDFKVNEKKLLNDEMSDVLKIFESLGVDKIQIDGEIDKKVSKIKENVEVIEDRSRQDYLNMKKRDRDRYKKIEKKEKKEEEILNEDLRADNSYEGLLLKDLSNKIDHLMEHDEKEPGLINMSYKLFNSALKDNKAKNLDKIALKEIKNKTKRKSNEFTSSVSCGSINFPLKSINKLQNKEFGITNNIKDSNINGNNIIKDSNNIKEINTNIKESTNIKDSSNTNIKESTLHTNNIKSGNLGNKTTKNNFNIPISFSKNIPNNLNNNNIISNQQSDKIDKNDNDKLIKNYDKFSSGSGKETLNYGNSNINNHKNFNTSRKLTMSKSSSNFYLMANIPPNNTFYKQNTFYSQKFYNQDIKKYETLHHNNHMTLKDKLLLPCVKYDHKTKEQPMYKPGNTEKLLNYEFYNSAYKNLSQLKPNNNLLYNDSLYLNNKYMWNRVESFCDSKWSKKIKLNSACSCENLKRLNENNKNDNNEEEL